jgi:hypothetical protein
MSLCSSSISSALACRWRLCFCSSSLLSLRPCHVCSARSRADEAAAAAAAAAARASAAGAAAASTPLTFEQLKAHLEQHTIGGRPAQQLTKQQPSKAKDSTVAPQPVQSGEVEPDATQPQALLLLPVTDTEQRDAAAAADTEGARFTMRSDGGGNDDAKQQLNAAEDEDDLEDDGMEDDLVVVPAPATDGDTDVQQQRQAGEQQPLPLQLRLASAAALAGGLHLGGTQIGGSAAPLAGALELQLDDDDGSEEEDGSMASGSSGSSSASDSDDDGSGSGSSGKQSNDDDDGGRCSQGRPRMGAGRDGSSADHAVPGSKDDEDASNDESDVECDSDSAGDIVFSGSEELEPEPLNYEEEEALEAEEALEGGSPRPLDAQQRQQQQRPGGAQAATRKRARLLHSNAAGGFIEAEADLSDDEGRVDDGDSDMEDDEDDRGELVCGGCCDSCCYSCCCCCCRACKK